MEKEFVPYEVALRLKAIGFAESSCFGYWEIAEKERIRINEYSIGNWNNHPNRASAPLYQQAFRWFRDNYNLHSVASFDKFIDEDNDVELDNPYFTYYYSINELWDNTKDYNKFVRGFMNVASSRDIMSQEEAELACLNKLIEIVEKKLGIIK